MCGIHEDVKGSVADMTVVKKKATDTRGAKNIASDISVLNSSTTGMRAVNCSAVERAM